MAAAVRRLAELIARRALTWGANWPRNAGRAWGVLFVFFVGGILSDRLNGMALVDLPFGPHMADGVPVMFEPDSIEPFPHVGAHTPAPGATLPSPLVIATDGTFPPFNFVDETGALRGLEVDFVYQTCAALRIACTLVTREWDALLPGLLDGDYDVVAASLRIPDTLPQGIAFSAPYFKTGAAFAKRADAPPQVGAGVVGVEAGTRMAAYLKAHTDPERIRIFAGPISVYQALAGGDVDTILDDAVRLNRWLHDPSAACCIMAGEPVFDATYFGTGVGFAVRADDATLLASLNAAIRTLRADGKIAELSDRYLPFALN